MVKMKISTETILKILGNFT